MLQTLGSGASYDRSNGPPLGGHKLGQMEQLLLFFSGPLGFLNAGIQPLIPTHKNSTLDTVLFVSTHTHKNHSVSFEAQLIMHATHTGFNVTHTHTPAGLALLGRLAVQQGGNTRPLVFPIFHHRCFQYFILGERGRM